ncbi:MAG: transglycosylase SLT domain-containing protein [Deltaproteobacteria bacterium]|nr:transglycosylase SLT domain-containing protein [Deltaproteobacteria bacterium]
MFRFFSLFRFVPVLSLLILLHLFGGSAAASETGSPSQWFIRGDYPQPVQVSLCGERMPLESRQVWEMLDREFTILVWDRAQVYMWLKRAGRYFPFIEKSLAEEGLPDDLKYLAVAESALIIDIRSKRSALGIWQFMAATARQNGLRKSRNMDERLSFELSTRAALKYLKRLKSIFGTWAMALAAYNCGDARLKNEIKEQQVSDFYRLRLPKETERFIYRISVIKIILEHPERYGYRLPLDRIYEPIKAERLKVNLPTPLHITKIAKTLGTDYKVLKELNPHILGRYFPAGKYEINVPYGHGAKLSSHLKKAVRTPPSFKTGQRQGDFYVVQPGDTLSQIARHTGIPIDTIKRLNRLKTSWIRVGQKLRLTSLNKD